MKDKLFILFQYLIPQKLVSCIAGKLANSQTKWFKNFFISRFIKHYKIDLAEAEHTDYKKYQSFNAFFTRNLQDSSRTIDAHASIISPVDGTISQIGTITDGNIFQAKGKEFTAASLLGSSEDAAVFAGGSFATVYLAPYNYHRMHAPANGNLEKITYIPGKLFSVNPTTVNNVPNLFAHNERVVTIFDTELGKIALVMVGALIVGSVDTKWTGLAANRYNFKFASETYTNMKVSKGEDIAHFELGSTIVLLSETQLKWEGSLATNSILRMGQKLVQ